MSYQILCRRLLKDGNLLSFALAALISITFCINPEIWVHDYPPDIQEKFGPKSDRVKRQTRGYSDYAFHLKTALPALPLAIIPSLIIAALTYGRSTPA